MLNFICDEPCVAMISFSGTDVTPVLNRTDSNTIKDDANSRSDREKIIIEEQYEEENEKERRKKERIQKRIQKTE